MSKFPGLVDWMDDYGLAELHAEHNEFVEDVDDKLSFAEYVEGHYDACEEMWEADVNRSYSLNVKMDEEGDVALESAKIVFATLLASAKHSVASAIEEENLAPDYNCVNAIADDFYNVVLPAVEKALQELGA